MENQALMAWRPYVFLKDYEVLTVEIWGPMSSGRTALDAQATFERKLINEEVVMWVRDQQTNEVRRMIVGDLALYAGLDEYGCVRIKSVYTGTNVQPVGWYRVTMPF